MVEDMCASNTWGAVFARIVLCLVVAAGEGCACQRGLAKPMLEYAQVPQACDGR